MSKFAKYAAQADVAAKKILQEMQAAEAAFEAARKAKENGPRIHAGAYGLDAQEVAKAARLETDYQETKAAFDRARRYLPEKGERELRAIRAELAGAIDSAYTIDPALVDAATLELMKSGICVGRDYEKLMADAERKGNTTMIRLIADHAGKAYEAAYAKAEKDPYGQRDDVELGLLHKISRTGQGATEKNLLEAFDAMTYTFQRSVNNTAMIGDWDGLVGPIVENF